MCMIELGELERHHEEFAKRHTRVIAVSVDGQDDSRLTQKELPHLVVVADSESKLITAIGAMHPRAGMHGEDVAAPTTVLVDGQGVVRSLYRPPQIVSRLSADEVLAMVDKELPRAR